MTLLFYIALSLLLLILQTVAEGIFFYGHGYDLFIPFIFYLSVFRPFAEGVPAVLGIGLFTDALSAAPFGLYLSTYLWFYAIVKWGHSFLHVRSRMFLPLLISLGVLFEESLFFISLRLSGTAGFSPLLSASLLARHLFWSAATGPFVFMGISFMHRKWQRQIRTLVPQRKE